MVHCRRWRWGEWRWGEWRWAISFTQNGVPAHDILDFALSRHTGEDALLARPIVERIGVRQLCIVTSDFHVERVALIFRRVFLDCSLEFVGAPYLPTCSPAEQKRLVVHEVKRIAELQAQM